MLLEPIIGKEKGASLHRPQISEDLWAMQAQAAEYSG